MNFFKPVSRLFNKSNRRRRLAVPTRQPSLASCEVLEDRTLLSAELGFVVGFGDTGTDQALDIVTDDAGNSYVTGLFQGTVDFDPGPGTANLTGAGIFDAFVAKYDSDGNLVWAQKIGGSGDVRGEGIALDALGNVHVAGRFSSTADLDTGAGTFNKTALGPLDVFVVKLDNGGNFVWGAQLGGSGDELNASITVDSAGNVFTAGSFDDFADADFDPGAGFFNPVVNGGGGPNDGFISKLDANGNFVWALGFGGGGSDGAGEMATDAAGNLYLAGTFRFTADLDPGAGVDIRTSAGSEDVFVMKLDSAGNLVWVSTMGGSEQDVFTDLTMDNAGYIITSGHFSGTMDFDPGAGTANITSVGAGDAFVLKLDGAGDFVWAKSFGSAGFDSSQGVVTDNAGNVSVTGSLAGTADFDPGADVFNLTSAGATDIFLWQLDSSGNFLDALSTGSTNPDFAARIALDDDENVLIVGGFRNTVDFDPGAGITSLTSAGADDGFLLKLVQNTPPVADAGPDQTTGGGQSTPFDATGSSDGDGEIVSYSWDFGDGNGYTETAGDAGDGTFDGMTSYAYADDGTFTVTLTVTDDQGASSSSTTTVTVLNVDPSVDAGANATIDEGSTFLGVGSFVDPETDTWTAAVNYGDGSGLQPLALNPDKTFSLSHLYDDNGTYAVTVTVTDDDGGVGSGTLLVTVNNVAPTAVLANGAAVDEGSSGSVSFSGQSDPSSADTAAGFLYSYDFDNDGVFEIIDSTSDSAVVPESFLDDGPGSRTVRARIADKDGGFTDDTTTITIVNVAPTPGIVGPTDGVRGQTRILTLTADDPSPVDQAAGFTFQIDWENDGIVDQTVTGLSGAEVSHIYTLADTYTVRVVVTDKDGGSATALHNLTIGVVQIQQDPNNPGQTLLAVGGTDSGNDKIKFDPGANPGEVQVLLDGVNLGTFTPTSRLLAFGQGGDDKVKVHSKIDVAAWLFGGKGDDKLRGGMGDDVLVGGDGNDLLDGKAGRDLLIGGHGADKIKGKDGEDILIGGPTSFDNNLNALSAIMDEWTSGASFQTRLDHLTGVVGGGLNGSFVLNTDSAAGPVTVFNDGDKDKLKGGDGADWLLGNLDEDKIILKMDDVFTEADLLWMALD